MSRQNLFLIIILIGAAAVNLLGAFGPELGFDALWYHLTIPKLYLEAGKIFHIPGGLLYYSEMPRLTEILYIPLLKFFGSVGPHLLSWAAGIGSTIIVYKLSRKYLSSFFSLLSSLVFYVTPLVGWESGSAYIDLSRTFFEILALYLVLSKKPVIAGIVLGLAISTKTLALGSLAPLFIVNYLITKNLRSSFFFFLFSLFFCMPWFIGSYLFTGYPFYPIGANILPENHTILFQILHPWTILPDFWKISLFPDDPISPLYLIFLPFLLFSLPQILAKAKPLVLYSFLGLAIWFYTPHLGGGRYLLPYLPAWAICLGLTLDLQKNKLIKSALILAIIIVALVNCLYRVGANFRLFPYLLGRQTKEQYLCRNLDLTVTYVNCNGFNPSGLVYIKGFHNLYFVNFPFVHETWYRGEKYNYIIQP